MNAIIKRWHRTVAMLFLLLATTACQKVDFGDDDDAEGTSGYAIRFDVEHYDIKDFGVNAQKTPTASRALVPVKDLGTVLNLAVYKDGKKIKQVDQQSNDEAFGHVTMHLDEGDYNVAVVVHSGNGNASMADVTKVKFPDNKVTDTFAYYCDLTVADDMTVEMVLNRRVAMYKLVLNDDVPADVKSLKFYYTGGSSTLNIATGFGSVDSRQTEFRTVSTHESGAEFALYTFPHDVEGQLAITVSALDAADKVVKETKYDSVPIVLNKVTEHRTSFFSDKQSTPGESGTAFSLSGNNDWSGTIRY